MKIVRIDKNDQETVIHRNLTHDTGVSFMVIYAKQAREEAEDGINPYTFKLVEDNEPERAQTPNQD